MPYCLAALLFTCKIYEFILLELARGPRSQMAPRTSSSGKLVVFHGAKHWTSGQIILAKCIEYFLGRGKSQVESFNYAEGLLTYLRDFSNKTILEQAMLNAQRSGVFNPFVSTSRDRSVARSFALAGNNPGFILTIEGPESEFYDFNKIRKINGIPHPVEFAWLNELGIPLRLDTPFRVIHVERIRGITEKKKTIERKRRR